MSKQIWDQNNKNYGSVSDFYKEYVHYFPHKTFPSYWKTNKNINDHLSFDNTIKVGAALYEYPQSSWTIYTDSEEAKSR